MVDEVRVDVVVVDDDDDDDEAAAAAAVVVVDDISPPQPTLGLLQGMVDVGATPTVAPADAWVCSVLIRFDEFKA